MGDIINSPEHYNSGNIEVIDFIEDQGYGKGFCLGSAIKYISRSGKKLYEGKSPIQSERIDLQKVLYYIKRRIKEIDEEIEK